ncbi:MAG: DUF1499 domain-containing protein, partial [Gemmatimonadota bacterium]
MKPTRAALLIGLVAALCLLISGPGVRLGLYQFPFGFTLLKWGAYAGIVAMILSVVLLLMMLSRTPRVGIGTLVLAFALGAVATGVPWFWLSRAKSAPPIHDVTTDTDNPPVFVAVLPLRANARNPASYGGKEVAAEQKKGYPDLRTLELSEAPAEAFRRAERAARAMGWDIVAVDSTAGRIEATATTGWFAFKDDVVVRVEGAGQ